MSRDDLRTTSLDAARVASAVILLDGSVTARRIAQETMKDVRTAVKLDYGDA